MCGICGYTGWQDEEVLGQMMQRLVHRGPDESGQFQESGISLGMRRLQVIDPSGGHQPLSNETGSVWLVLNGEIYNYRELRHELMAKGHHFRTHTDTEVIVHLYEQEGEAGFQRLRGMFAFALWDRDQQTLLIARDQFGIKPLYYRIHNQEIIFASELPALIAALPATSIRPEAIRQYLTFLYVPGPATIYEGISQLPPGEMLKVQKGRIERYPFAKMENWAERESTSFREHPAEYFLEVLQETVRSHLVSDVPLGLFLSGGLDSASILAMMRRETNGPIKTFSIGYAQEADHSYNELSAARSLADHFGTDHVEEQVNPDVVQLLPNIVEAMGEPFADSSVIPTYLVSEVARRSVTVALSGIGGDELFGGYPRYLGIRAASYYSSLPLPWRRWLGESVAPHIPESVQGRNLTGRIKRFLSHGHLSPHDQYLQWVMFLPKEWSTSAFSADLQHDNHSTSIQHLYREHLRRWPSQEAVDQAMGMDLQTYLPDDLLKMGDRLSMRHSLELRVPFCDQRLLRFALSLPASLRFSGWQLKGFMRKALQPCLPKSIVNAPKRGFMVPIGRWLRQDLREMVHDVLSDDRVRRRGYVNPHYVQWLMEEHETGRRNFTDQLFALVVLELWHENASSSKPVPTLVS